MVVSTKNPADICIKNKLSHCQANEIATMALFVLYRVN